MIARQNASERAKRLWDALIGDDYRLALIRIGLALIVLVRHNDYLRGFWHPKHHGWVFGPEFGPATLALSEPHLHAPLWPHLDVVANFAGVLVELRTALAVLLLLGVFPSLHALILAVVSFVLMASDRFQYTHHLWFLYSGVLLFGLGGLIRRPGVLMLLRCQLAVVYLAAGLAKLNPVWLSGAELRAFSEFGIVQSATLESAARRVGWGAFAVAIACGELLLPALLAFRRTRTFGLLSAVGLHAAIEQAMTISTFGITMMVLLLSYLPSLPLKRGTGPSEASQPIDARFHFQATAIALALALLSPLGAAVLHTRVGSYRMFTELFRYELTLSVDGEPTSTAVLLPHLGRDAARIVRLANGRGVGEVSAELLEGALPQVNDLLCAIRSDASEVVSSLTLRPLAPGASRTTRSVRRCSAARGYGLAGMGQDRNSVFRVPWQGNALLFGAQIRGTIRPVSADAKREARAERRRATYFGHVVRLGEPKPALYSEKTLLERLVLQTNLVLRQAALSGHPLIKLPRAQWPGEVFDIDARNRRTT